MIKAARFSSGILRMVRHGDELVAALRAMRSTNVLDNREHLKLAGDWLLFAQSVNADGGYAHSYSLHQGWEQSYPETTGYIIPTMLRLSDYLKDDRYRDSAFRAGSWLLAIQRPDGSFPDLDGQPQVFDTGQIIEGLLAVSATTHDPAYLTAASRAGDFLISCQDPDGSWTSFSYHRVPHTYYTRVAANLLRLSQATGEHRYAVAGQNNLRWALTRQSTEGFFSNMSFRADEAPILHTIIYVLEGLLDGYELTHSDELYLSVNLTVDKLVDVNQKQDFILYSRYNEHWRPQRFEKCLTGLAQWAGLLLKLYTMTKNQDYFCQAVKTLYYLKSKQIVKGSSNIVGAFSGSIPLWGDYFRFAFNNWTVKFFIDALLALDEHNIPVWKEQELFVSESFEFNSRKFYDPGSIRLYAPYTTIIESVMKTFPENAAFLDLGCGEGHLIKQLSTLHPDIAFVGIEPTFFNKTGSDASKARLLKRSIYELPLLDNSMDIILVKEVLQHVAFMTKAFEEIRRISKRGARIIVIKRNPFSILGLLKKPFELSGRWMYPWDSPFRERDGI